jgi:uncharacterized membrane protein YGL010W
LSKADRLKEEIGWLKVIFGILAATDISLIAWLAQSYAKASVLLLISCGFAVVIITVIVIWVNHTAYRKIDELEDL